MNIFDCLERSSQYFGDKEALWFKGKSYSFKELHAQASILAGGLRQLGLENADKVALFLPNIPEFAISYYGIAKLGAVVTSVNVMLKRAELAHIIEDSESSAMITTAALVGQVPAEAETPKLKKIIVLGNGQSGDGARPDERVVSYGELMRKAEPLPRPTKWDRDDIAAILYTSGTTGRQKGAMLTHGNLTFNVLTAAYHSKMTPEDAQLLYLPLFHVFGQNYIMNSSIACGSKLVLHERFELAEILDSIVANKVTMFYGVPTIYIRLLSVEGIEEKLSSVRYYFSAAATMPREIARQWREKFGKVINEGYGLTETSPFASYNHDYVYKPGSIGTPVGNVEMKVVDENDDELPLGQIGEICIKGPNVMKGYYNRPEETAAAIKNGWFHSGDVGSMDEDGYFFIVDRVKDMINSAGLKIWPREVEEFLFQHPAIQEAAVVGVPDAEYGESVKAFIVLKENAVASEEEIIRFCRERIAVYKAPKFVQFVEALPKNASGKILKKDLRALQ